MARAPSSISARMVRAQMSIGVAPAANSSASAGGRHRHEGAERRERLRVRAAVVEDAEDARQLHAAAIGFAEEPRDARALVMRDDLRQVELRVDALVQQEVDLTRRRPHAGSPIRRASRSGCCARIASRSSHACVDAARLADALVAAEHDQRRKPVLPRAVGVRQADTSSECLDVRNGTTRDAIDVGAQVGDEVTEVVFFLRADRAVGQEDEQLAPREAADGAIRVDPGVHRRGCPARPAAAAARPR